MTLPFRLRFALLVGLYAVYAFVFVTVYRRLGTNVGPLGMVPIVAGAYFFGARGGLWSGLVFLPLQAGLFFILGVLDDVITSPLAVGALGRIAAGSVAGYVVGKYRDMALALKAEVDLRHEVEREIAHLLDGAPDAVVTVDREGKIVLVNDRALLLFGRGRAELLGRSVELLLRPPAGSGAARPWAAFFEKSPRAEGGPVHGLFGIRSDGSEFPVELTLNPLQTQNGLMVSNTVRDLSETQRTEHLRARLAQESAARVAAEEASRMKSTFMALISHEVRTPLSSLNVNLRVLLQSRREPRAENEQRAEQAVRRASKRLGDLVESVLEYSRLESSALVVRKAPFDVGAMAQELACEFRAEAQEKGLTLSCQLSAQMPPLHSDAALLRLVVSNLLHNAVKYTDEGGIALSVHSEDGQCRVEVRDSGPGIAAADQERIFKPFEQLEAIDHKHRPGVGLGLTLVARLSEALGGRIALASQPGQGSTFTVWLPSNAS